MSIVEKRLLTVNSTARYLGVRDARVTQLIREGKINAIRLGRQIRIDPVELEAFCNAGGAPLAGGWRREARS
jgi:excisionase family DNA binding protein